MQGVAGSNLTDAMNFLKIVFSEEREWWAKNTFYPLQQRQNVMKFWHILSAAVTRTILLPAGVRETHDNLHSRLVKLG